MIKKKREKLAVRCECGFIATGNSIDNAKANLKLHKKSKRHKNFLSLSRDISNGEVKDISGSNLLPAENKIKQPTIKAEEKIK